MRVRTFSRQVFSGDLMMAFPRNSCYHIGQIQMRRMLLNFFIIKAVAMVTSNPKITEKKTHTLTKIDRVFVPLVFPSVPALELFVGRRW